MSRRRLLTGAALTVLTAVAGTVQAQDIEVTAQLRGRKLPPGYYERVRQDPGFFQIEEGWIAKAAQAAAQGSAVTGELFMPIVHALFSDSPTPHIAISDVQAALFDGPSAAGTVREFYSETSGGSFTVGGQALPWVRTQLLMDSVVGNSFGLGNDAKVGEYLVQALTAADSIVDFGLFDNDGPDNVPNSGDDDGTVDALAFQFLEIAASCGGPAIWPHRSAISRWPDAGGQPFATEDLRPDGRRILVNSYIIQSATDCGGVEIQKATTIAHELGHVLGLPDLYDASDGILPEQRRWVVGCWGLMAGGAWGCGTLNRADWVRPTHLSAWSKIRLGWAVERVLGPDLLAEEITLPAVQAGREVLRVPLDTNEYMLVEYRQRTGFDRDLPAEGVLIYHIDPQLSFRPCPPCQVQLVEADGNETLVRPMLQGGNLGEAGDAFAVTASSRLTASTNPSTRRHSGAESPVTFYSIALAGGIAQLKVSTRTVATAQLLESFLGDGSAPLTAVERAYLDSVGNQGGSYDVGDLRAYLTR